MQLAEHEPPLAHGLGHRPDLIQPGDAFAPAWQDIEARLAPIIGKRGAAALYERSVQLQLNGAEAGSTSLLQTVRELLGPMIGPGLTERLLGANAFVGADAHHSITTKTDESLP
jgi:hypothetical protein